MPSTKDWINEVRTAVNLAQCMDQPKRPCTTIFRVPRHIRQLDPKAYEPVIAYLGPFHHNSSMTTFKWWCVRHLLSRHRSQGHASQLLNECLLELKKQDDKVRSCYSEEFSELDAQAMAVIMLLDGCFIIYLMLYMSPKEVSLEEEVEKLEGEATEEDGKDGEATEEDEGKKKREWMTETRKGEVLVLNIEEKDKKGKGIAKEIEEEEVGNLEGDATCMNEPREGEVVLNIYEKEEQLYGPTVAGLFTIDVVVYDLLKLENQIPFFIIQLLFHRLKACQDEQINLVDLALELFEGIHPEKSKSLEKKSPGDYHHLLHLFYSSRIPSEMPGEAAPSRPREYHYHRLPYSTSAPTRTTASRNWKKAKVDPLRESPTSAPKWIPSATELDRAGVKFERKKQADSFLNIKFGRRKMKLTLLLCLRKLFLLFKSGRMKIPQLQIYDYTGPLFRNLIAFEQCYFDTEMYITIYALFMDCIIDQAEDVRLLHLNGILQHGLSNDQAVADLINQLGSQIHHFPGKNYLLNQIEEVNRFYEGKWHKRLATLRRDYLGNPWAKISVLAATLLLLLTVEQAVFSALSYLHPLSGENRN